MRARIVVPLLFLAANASAQFATPYFSPDPRHRKRKDEPTAIAQAVELAFGATTWTTIHISTNGPVIDLSRLNAEGFYKRELIILVVIAADAKKPFEDVVAKRKKGADLADIAYGYGLDYDKVYDAALAIEDVVDKQYLPLFPQRPPARPRYEDYYWDPFWWDY